MAYQLLNPLRGSGLHSALYHGFTPAVIQIESLQDSAGKTAKWLNFNNPVRSAGRTKRIIVNPEVGSILQSL
jgi:hypothetical protein